MENKTYDSGRALSSSLHVFGRASDSTDRLEASKRVVEYHEQFKNSSDLAAIAVRFPNVFRRVRAKVEDAVKYSEVVIE